MAIDLMPWMIVWALVTTVVIALALWRNMLGLHDLGGIHIGAGEEKDAELEAQLTRKIARIEAWGKVLTVVSGVLIVGIGLVWAFHGLA